MLRGDLDLAVAGELFTSVSSVEGPVVLDMENVTFFDSSALGVVIDAGSTGST